MAEPADGSMDFDTLYFDRITGAVFNRYSEVSPLLDYQVHRP